MSFTSELGKKIGRDKKETETLLAALGQAMAQHCGDLDSVAIPGFGSFESVKHNETIVKDKVSDTSLLLPPEIVLNFRAAGRLRKLAKRNVAEEGEL